MTKVVNKIPVFLYFFLLIVNNGISQNHPDEYIYRISETIIIDGVLNESVWKEIPAVPLTMIFPVHEGELTEKTEIRIVYDDNYVYVAGWFYDSEPHKVYGNSLVRDREIEIDDYFTFILDTYNDNKSALAFCTTPAGIKIDYSIYNDAEITDQVPLNYAWSTFWDVKTTRTDQGWFAEMRIPFSSLRFQDVNGKVEMGLITWRWIARKGEGQIFPNIPPNWDLGHFKPSIAKDVTFNGIYSRNPFYLTPYALGGYGELKELNDSETAYKGEIDRIKEIGLDLKYGITSNLTMDLTLNTDFAQAEVDDELVNLTRFSLFFPEKRLFFQERSSIFDFNTGGISRLFYTRSIGLDEDGNQIDIYGGLRMVGRIGEWDVGLLDMQTEKYKDIPSENFGVLRVKRRVFNENSTIGGMLTSRLGKKGEYNYSYGIDGLFRFYDENYILVNWAHSLEDSLVNENNADFSKTGRMNIVFEKRKKKGFKYRVETTWSGLNYNPSMGFTERSDYSKIASKLSYSWIIGKEEKSVLQNHAAHFFSSVYQNNTDKKIESAEIGPEWRFMTKNVAYGVFGAKMNFDRLTEEFELSDSIIIPIGKYTYYSINMFYQTPVGNAFNSAFSLNAGSYYDGWKITYGLIPKWSVSRYLELGFDYEINYAEFKDRNQYFKANIFRLRTMLNFDIHLSTNLFAQYNSSENHLSLNFRLRYNFNEGNDLYFVYNEGVNTDRFAYFPTKPKIENRVILLKYNYTFVFGSLGKAMAK